MVVIDSVAALVPRSELEGDMGDATVGAQARLMSQAMRKLTSAINKSNCMMLFINQPGRRSASCSATRKPRPVATR